ncbi:MFS transporter [Corynebacterium lizhenjunii]|uniref:MFS transporter n=1 Tax=Corynebacterium lizhenjunii TaxID=2709394 RepID=A0A7T0KGM2_9CORY|nr:MFS transporter [Corynebacterium lizhenjunii]QPK79594.1 MFS transporter [Corynebacterium lizhenjunii]
MSLWHNRDYRLLMSGQTVSVIGNQITTFALFLAVLNVTNSPTTASFVSGLFVLSMVVFGLPIGRLVDRFPRLLILRVAVTIGLVGSLLCVWAAISDSAGAGPATESLPEGSPYSEPLAGGSLTGTSPVLLFALGALVLGAVNSAFGTAERAFLKEIVPPDLLAKAMAVNQGRYSIGVIAGPPIAGLLLAHSNHAPFWADAASFVWVLGCLLLIRPQPKTQLDTPAQTPPLRPAWEWLKSQKQLFAIGWYSPLLNFSFAGITTLSLLSLKYADLSTTALGTYQAGIGIAGLVGAIVAGKLVESTPAGPMLLTSMVLFSVSLGATVINPLLPSPAGLWLIIAGMVLAGLFLPKGLTPLEWTWANPGC